MLFSWGRFRRRVTAVLHLDESPSRLAASIAVGVFIGITPFYCSNFCSALHQEMQGYIEVRPKGVPVTAVQRPDAGMVAKINDLIAQR